MLVSYFFFGGFGFLAGVLINLDHLIIRQTQMAKTATSSDLDWF
jgi:hypothetical protein